MSVGINVCLLPPLLGCQVMRNSLGGAELLFDGVKKHQVTLPEQEGPWKYMQTLPVSKAEASPAGPAKIDKGGRGLRCSLSGLVEGASMCAYVGHPEPPCLDQEELAKRAARALHPGRECAARNSGAD
nr:ubiquitin-related modifier 1 isoform X3 [Peromyscus maniculatus bairdii]